MGAWLECSPSASVWQGVSLRISLTGKVQGAKKRQGGRTIVACLLVQTKCFDWLSSSKRSGTGAARATRENAGLTTGDMGRAVGVDSSTVWRWERGIRRPRGAAALRYGSLLQRLRGGSDAAA